MRVAVFGSFYRGVAVLNELLFGPLRETLQVVGVATDDPAQSFVSPSRRVWQYPHAEWEEEMMVDAARRREVPVYRGRVKHQDFYQVFEDQWRPDLCITATFGQLIDQRLFSFPQLGFYNLHPFDGGRWPSDYAGGNPFQMMIDDGRADCCLALHHVDAAFDTGRIVATSERIAIPAGASVPDMHKITSPFAGLLVRRHLAQLLSARGAAGAEADARVD